MWQNARVDFSRVLALEPNNASILLDRARCYAQLKQWDAAVRDYTLAGKLNPTDPFSFRERGAIYQLIGKQELAQKDRERSLRLDQNTFEIAFPKKAKRR